MDELTATSAERLSLPELVALAGDCAKAVQPVFDRWRRSAKYRLAIKSAINYIERIAGATYSTAQRSGPVGIVAVDIASKKAHADHAHAAGFAASTVAASALAAQMAADLAISIGQRSKEEALQQVREVVVHAHRQMLLSYRTQTDWHLDLRSAGPDVSRLLALDLQESCVEDRSDHSRRFGYDVIWHWRARRHSPRATGTLPILFACYGAIIGAAYGAVLCSWMPSDAIGNLCWSVACITFFGIVGWIFAIDSESSIAQVIVCLPLIPLFAPVVLFCMAVFALTAIAIVPVGIMARRFDTQGFD